MISLAAFPKHQELLRLQIMEIVTGMPVDCAARSAVAIGPMVRPTAAGACS
jgi:hypothetical protein